MPDEIDGRDVLRDGIRHADTVIEAGIYGDVYVLVDGEGHDCARSVIDVELRHICAASYKGDA